MKIIKPASENVLKILGFVPAEDGRYRPMKYCVSYRTDEGSLFYNLLTGELLLLENGEDASKIPELKERWFFVPTETDEMKTVDSVRFILNSLFKPDGYITDYEIFTTTDCNARCFYCYEKNRSRIPMSDETADKTAEFIKLHSKPGKTVNIRWFGGEPLCNKRVIDRICAKLREYEIDFGSVVVTNGYLFDEQTVLRAVSEWHLVSAQITLDGTEKVYNESKAYIYKSGNPYKTVIENIERLLKIGVKVSIRLNIGPYNKDDLLMLADELHARFCEPRKPFVYVHPLYAANDPRGDIQDGEERLKIYGAMQKLKEKLLKYGLYHPDRLKKTLALRQCGADCGKRVTVLPGGELGLCENYSESEFVGDIDNGITDRKTYDSWHEYCDPLPECKECFYYPQCLRLKKCDENSKCFAELREERLSDIKASMKYELSHKMDNNETASENENDC